MSDYESTEGEPIANLLPVDDSVGHIAFFSAEDWEKIKALRPGTKLYAGAQPVPAQAIDWKQRAEVAEAKLRLLKASGVTPPTGFGEFVPVEALLQGATLEDVRPPDEPGYCCYGGTKTRAECGNCAKWSPAVNLIKAPVQAVHSCKLGLYGRAFDGKKDRRAYTYEHQPDNVVAHRLGSAVRSIIGAGDYIDTGLGLLKELAALGFGIFELNDGPAEAPVQAVPDELQDAIFAVFQDAGFKYDHQGCFEIGPTLMATTEVLEFANKLRAVAPPSEPALAVPEYVSAMGDAANAYHATFKTAHPLPVQWRWSDLWQAMLAAAPSPAGSSEINDSLQALANVVCEKLPEGFVLSICMEKGAAWLLLVDGGFEGVDLPDSADKPLLIQVYDALSTALTETSPTSSGEES